jgi:chromosome segregation ATPase
VAYSDLFDLATQLDQGLTTASAQEGDLSAITEQLAAKDSELAELQQAKGEVEAKAEYLEAETQRLTDEAEATKRQLDEQATASDSGRGRSASQGGDPTEQLAAFQTASKELTLHRITLMFHRLDRDGNGTISKEVLD